MTVKHTDCESGIEVKRSREDDADVRKARTREQDRPMNVLCVADAVVPELYHRFDADRFGNVDLILSCGDLPPEYLSFLVGAFNAPLYYIKGNHDIRYAAKPPEGCTDIHGRIIRHRGLRILGLEGSRWYNGGPYQYTEAQMRQIIWRLRPKLWWHKGVDIILTHAPPRFIHDAEDLCHKGFRVYRKLIDRYVPRFFLHGHIHAHFTDDSERFTDRMKTRIINCYGYYQLKI